MRDRRDVLRAGAYLSAAGLVTGLTGREAAGAARHAALAPSSGKTHEPDWQALKRRLSAGARVYRPWEEQYAQLAPPWNLRYAGNRPEGIVSCATTSDVQVSLGWAREYEMPLMPRAGGHNYAGYSTTPGLLINVRRMREVSRQGDRLRVGGGATNADVFQAGRSVTGLYVPGGRCPGVGVAGLTLGGGLGFNDRKWGLTCDNLVATEVVLADGTLVRASEDTERELFWACRGGAGGNFGVNTGFLYDAVDVSDTIATVFSLTFDPRHGVRVMRILQEHLLAHDHGHDLDLRVEFGNPGSGDATLAVLGQRLGDEAALRARLRPLLEIGPSQQTIKQYGFWDAEEFLAMKPEVGAMASRSLVPGEWLPDDAIAAIVDWTLNWKPGPQGNPGYVTLFAMGGAITERRPHETAFPHRDATFVIDVGTSWQPGAPDEAVRSQLAQTRRIHHHLGQALHTSAAYVNFPDPDLNDWPTAYYGDNYGRLAQVKTRYDRHRVFRYDQGVRPA